MADDVKLAAILADLKGFEKRVKEGGLTGDEKAGFSKTVAELDALLAEDDGGIELPRLVKKENGETKRVDTKAELDAALADGWLLRLHKMPEVETDSSEALKREALKNGDEDTAAKASDVDGGAGDKDSADAAAPGNSLAERVNAMSAKDAIEAIEVSTDIDELKALKKVEERVTVERAIENRIAELKAE